MNNNAEYENSSSCDALVVAATEVEALCCSTCKILMLLERGDDDIMQLDNIESSL